MLKQLLIHFLYGNKYVLGVTKIGKKSYISKNHKIRKGNSKIIIGEKTSISQNCRLMCYDSYYGKNNSFIQIGNNCSFNRNLTIYSGEEVIIGDNVLIASDVLITSENHGMNPQLASYSNQPLICKKVIIEDGVWLGDKVVVLPGVTIGEKSIIGAGSIVTKDIPKYSIAVGNPAKVIKKFDFQKNDWVNV